MGKRGARHNLPQGYAARQGRHRMCGLHQRECGSKYTCINISERRQHRCHYEALQVHQRYRQYNLGITTATQHAVASGAAAAAAACLMCMLMLFLSLYSSRHVCKAFSFIQRRSMDVVLMQRQHLGQPTSSGSTWM